MFEILHQIHNTVDGTCLIMVISLSVSLSLSLSLCCSREVELHWYVVMECGRDILQQMNTLFCE